MIDLHLHTNMSDGSDTPPELLDKVIKSGCKVFSVTDHDDLRANAGLLSAVRTGKYNIRFITGAEISSVFRGRNLHLLCYGFNPDAESMKKLINEGCRLRHERITALLEHLRIKHGIIIPEEDKADILSRTVPGKVHVTDAAMKLGIKMSRPEFFKTRLDDMESREFKISAERVISLVCEAGGLVSFAHPVETQKEYGLNFTEITEIAKNLKAAGLSAIEVYHSMHGAREVSEYAAAANKTGLLVSGGSDYHGINKDARIGQLTSYGNVPKDDEITILSALKTQF